MEKKSKEKQIKMIWINGAEVLKSKDKINDLKGLDDIKRRLLNQRSGMNDQTRNVAQEMKSPKGSKI